jgi:glycerate 2-kinase
MSLTMSEIRKSLRSLYDAAVAAAHPAHFLPAHLPEPPARGRIILLAAGKAAGSMSAVAENHYLASGIAPERIAGIAVARHGYAAPTRLVEMIEAGHPVPDQAGIEATAKTIAMAESAEADDLVLVLLSGGGSANWIAPAAGVSLTDKQAVTRALLRSGASILEINTVRRHLSRIKGGRLAWLASPARVLTLAISDVPGDEPAAIASGPTVPDATKLSDARMILNRYAITPPESVAKALQDMANETPKSGDPVFKQAEYRIVARPHQSLVAAAEQARILGYETYTLGADLEGEARDIATEQAKLALEIKRKGRRLAILSGGELTVTIRGQGKGGPNQEFALALALALKGEAGIAAVAGDTDGTDGGGGLPTDPAGAFIDATTLHRAGILGLDAEARLQNNDSTGFFEPLGDLLTPGPTLTNVNDLRAILVDP